MSLSRGSSKTPTLTGKGRKIMSKSYFIGMMFVGAAFIASVVYFASTGWKA